MEVLCEKRCALGEGPIWNEFDKKLYHVNGYGLNEIIEISLDTRQIITHKLDFGVSAIAFSKSGEILITCEDGAFKLNSSGSREPLYDTKKYRMNFANDAKVGPDGRFYVGTQSSKRKGFGDAVDGKLYSIDKNGEVKILLDGLILSNGFDWSMDEKRLYHTDSDTDIIKEYDFDKETGEISFTGRQVSVRGVDGITIDKNDFLYVACWGEGHIAVVDTADMQIKEYLAVPAKIPASCCFVGENMDILAVVTVGRGAEEGSDAKAGCTFVCKTKTNGRKPYLFG